jgi:peptidoglycan/LPS O-acetylase OafA/YrhL
MSRTPHIDSMTIDGMAIAISALCVLHCLVAPIAVLVFPILATSLWASHEFHAWLLALILPSSALALWLGCRRHRSGLILGLGLAGMAVLVLAAVLGPQALTGPGEVLVTALGGALLAAGHVLNFRRCRALQCEERDCARHQAARA